MGGLRILLANEPRSYRETLAAVLQTMRPATEVRTAEPNALGHELESFAPQLVVCSNLTPAVEADTISWIELYYDHGPLSTVSVGGNRSITEGIELPDLLSIVDRTEFLLETA